MVSAFKFVGELPSGAGSWHEVQRLFDELDRPLDRKIVVAELARMADRMTSPRFRRRVGAPN